MTPSDRIPIAANALSEEIGVQGGSPLVEDDKVVTIGGGRGLEVGCERSVVFVSVVAREGFAVSRIPGGKP
jgi:hypothetical protein